MPGTDAILEASFVVSNRKKELMKMRQIVLMPAILALLLVQSAHAFYNPVKGSWLSRDPIGEKGGLNHYEYACNNPNSKLDLVGCMALSDIYKIYRQRALATQARNICCWFFCDAINIDYSISGKSSGSDMITASALWADNKSGVSCGPFNSTYYWWDCYSGTAEVVQLFGLIEGASDSLRGEYGWSSGSAQYTRNYSPNEWAGISQYLGFDPYSLAISSFVIYEECVHGQMKTTMKGSKNGLLFEWDFNLNNWAGPSLLNK